MCMFECLEIKGIPFSSALAGRLLIMQQPRLYSIHKNIIHIHEKKSLLLFLTKQNWVGWQAIKDIHNMRTRRYKSLCILPFAGDQIVSTQISTMKSSWQVIRSQPWTIVFLVPWCIAKLCKVMQISFRQHLSGSRKIGENGDKLNYKATVLKSYLKCKLRWSNLNNGKIF